MTGSSSMIGRFLREDNSVKMKRLHGLEAMRLIGWETPMWKGGVSPFETPGVTPELLTDMAGNAWSAYAFVPVWMSAVGAASFDMYKAEPVHSKKTQSDGADQDDPCLLDFPTGGNVSDLDQSSDFSDSD